MYAACHFPLSYSERKYHLSYNYSESIIFWRVQCQHISQNPKTDNKKWINRQTPFWYQKMVYHCSGMQLMVGQQAPTPRLTLTSSHWFSHHCPSLHASFAIHTSSSFSLKENKRCNPGVHATCAVLIAPAALKILGSALYTFYFLLHCWRMAVKSCGNLTKKLAICFCPAGVVNTGPPGMQHRWFSAPHCMGPTGCHIASSPECPRLCDKGAPDGTNA